MPYSIVEAFAAGTPVVGTRIGGIPELVAEGVTGFVCEPGDVSSMARALVRAVEAFSSPLHMLGCRGIVVLMFARIARVRNS